MILKQFSISDIKFCLRNKWYDFRNFTWHNIVVIKPVKICMNTVAIAGGGEDYKVNTW